MPAIDIEAKDENDAEYIHISAINRKKYLLICRQWHFWFERKPHPIDRSSDEYENERGKHAQELVALLFHTHHDLICKTQKK